MGKPTQTNVFLDNRMQSEPFTQSTGYLERNAKRVSLTLLASIIGAISIAVYVAYDSGQDFIYYYAGFFCLVGVFYAIGTALVFRGQRIAGIGLQQFALICGFTSITFSFVNIAINIAIIVGFSVWMISVLTLEDYHQFRASLVGVFFALGTIIVDLFWPYPRILLTGANLGTVAVGVALISTFLYLFFSSFKAYSIRSKLIVVTVSIVLFATAIPLIVAAQLTRSALTESTQVEIELRAERVASEITTQLDRQIDRLITLGDNQQIINFVTADSIDVEQFDPEIVDLVLERRNEIWINLDNDFVRQQHFPFYSRLKNPVGDILRNYTQQFDGTEQLFIVNRYGSIVAMANADDTPVYLYDETDWWKHIMDSANQGAFIGQPEAVSSGSSLTIPIAVPLLDTNNNLIGAIFIAYSTNDLILSLGTTGSEDEQTDFSLVLDSQSVLPLVPGQRVIQASPVQGPQIQDLYEMNFIELRNLESTDLVTAAPLPQDAGTANMIPPAWGVLVSRPLETVEEVIQTQQRTQIFLGLALALIGILLARLLSRTVSAPIVKLAGVAQLLKSGELSARAEVESADEVGGLSLAFNEMAEQSQLLVNQLESRVAERTQALETSFQVSQTISSINEKDALVLSVVNQLQSAFDYYHVHIYLFDKIKNMLCLVAGSGEPGKQLLEQNHALRPGQGLVGRAAVHNVNVLVPDVNDDPQWVANRLLPDTKSELAVPITLAGEVLGVIDVQDDEISRFTEQDANLLRSIADQVAVALRNAEQFESARSRANRELRLNSVREKILRTQDIDSAMKIAAREISQMLGNKSAAVYLKPMDPAEPVQREPVSQKPSNGSSSAQSSNGTNSLNGDHS